MDIKCVVCGEPWHAAGINGGDMLPWQAELFKKGAGCPSCEGIEPEEKFEPQTIADIENGDGDPVERLNLIDNRDSRPKWAPPPPKLLYKCDACKCEVFQDLEEADEVFFARGDDIHARFQIEKLDNEQIKQPVKFEEHNLTVCQACIEICDDCDAKLCSRLSTDVYDGLASFSGSECGLSHNDTYCIDCFERNSSENESEDSGPEDNDDDSEEELSND